MTVQEERDALSLRALAEVGRAHRELRSATASALPKILAEAGLGLTPARGARYYAVRGDRVVPLACAPAAPGLGNPLAVDESGFADVIESAKPRLSTSEELAGVRLTTKAPGAIVPVTVGGEVSGVLTVCGAGPGLSVLDLEVLVQLCESAGARTAELERSGGHERLVVGLRERLSILEGDPSRGRRRGDGIVSSGDDAAAIANRVLQDLGAEVPFGVLAARLGLDGWVVAWANELLATMLGTSSAKLTGPLADVLNTGVGGPVVDPVELLNAAPHTPFQTELVRPDGSDFDGWIFGLGQLTSEPTVLIGVLDVADRIRRLRELERVATTDPITGLTNRARATELLEELLGGEPVGSVAVMMLDLDRFKNVNDSLGHVTGDLLLVEVTQRLRAFVPPGTIVSRLGGDEFLLVFNGMEDVLDVHPLAYGLLEALAEPYDLRSGHRVTSSVSIGISIASNPGQSANDLIREADLAMYQAKDLGRNRYALCDSTMLAAADQRLDREIVLRRALDADGLRLQLQPIVDLGTERLVEFEALVRLHDEELGEVSPADFISIAEETGLISQIDHWVIEQALSLFSRDVQLRADPDLRIAVNISGRTLERMDFISKLVVALNKYELQADRLVVEITESCLLGDNRAILWTLKQLRDRGAAIAIDDFGTGYSSLSYLQSFKVDVLKIDQSFVSRINKDEVGDMMIANIVRLAHDLGLHVVAEGVEEPYQAELLRSLHCDLAQGWLYGRPAEPQTDTAHQG